MLEVFVHFILFFLAIQVLPIAYGINRRTQLGLSMLFVLAATAVSGFVFWGGYVIGNRIMGLTSGFGHIVFFVGFFLIGIRMLMESFNIRKGERTYAIESIQPMFAAIVGQSINTFLAGILLYYIPEQSISILLVSLMILVFLCSLTGILVGRKRLGFVTASLLYFMGGMGMVVASVYLGFFVL